MSRPVWETGLSVKRLQMRHGRAIDAALAPHGISLVQWDALRHLQRNPNASLHDLAELTFQSDQAFGTLAARMVEHGLIQRVPGPGRAIRHRLTERGDELRVIGDRIVDDVLAVSFSVLTPRQLATFDRLLVRVLTTPNPTPDRDDPPFTL